MTVEALWADICRNFAVWKGVGHFERKFQGERGVPTNDFWHHKSRVPGLSYGKKIAEKFNRLSRVHQRHRQTDKQTTDGIAIAYSKRNVIRWRLLKTWSYLLFIDSHCSQVGYDKIHWSMWNWLTVGVKKLDCHVINVALFAWSYVTTDNNRAAIPKLTTSPTLTTRGNDLRQQKNRAR